MFSITVFLFLMLCLLTASLLLKPSRIYIYFNEITGQINTSLAVEWITFYKQCYLRCDQTIKGKFMTGCCCISAGMLKCKLCAQICASGPRLNYGLPRQVNVRHPDWTFEGSKSWRWQTIWLHDNSAKAMAARKNSLFTARNLLRRRTNKETCRTETHTGWPILS